MCKSVVLFRPDPALKATSPSAESGNPIHSRLFETGAAPHNQFGGLEVDLLTWG